MVLEPKSFWHRFPKELFRYLLGDLKSSFEKLEIILDKEEQIQLQQQVKVMEKGYREKEDLDLNMLWLKNIIEFSLVMELTDQREILLEVLGRLKTYLGKKGGVA